MGCIFFSDPDSNPQPNCPFFFPIVIPQIESSSKDDKFSENKQYSTR